MRPIDGFRRQSPKVANDQSLSPAHSPFLWRPGRKALRFVIRADTCIDRAHSRSISSNLSYRGVIKLCENFNNKMQEEEQ